MQEQNTDNDTQEQAPSESAKKSPWVGLVGRVFQIAGFAGLLAALIIFSQSSGSTSLTPWLKGTIVISALVCYLIGRVMLFIDHRNRRG